MNKDITLSPKLEEIAIKIDAHGKAAIENILTVGKLLCEATVWNCRLIMSSGHMEGKQDPLAKSKSELTTG